MPSVPRAQGVVREPPILSMFELPKGNSFNRCNRNAWEPLALAVLVLGGLFDGNLNTRDFSASTATPVGYGLLRNRPVFVPEVA